MKYIIGYIIICYIVFKIIVTYQNRYEKRFDIQNNWREYYKRHPNNNIYYQARHKKEYEETKQPKKKNSIIPFIVFVIIALYIVSKIAK